VTKVTTCPGDAPSRKPKDDEGARAFLSEPGSWEPTAHKEVGREPGASRSRPHSTGQGGPGAQRHFDLTP
jgi:hypothetical protein